MPVVEDHRLAVAAEPDVELDSISALDRGRDCAAAILDQRSAVEAAMGEGNGSEPVELSPP
jgi:hypothetical protein